MSRRFTRLSLLLVLLLSGNAWAIGLGDIKLESALNEPLRAEISLLSASPEELAELKVALASAETFQRYGIDRPFFLQGIQFNVVSGGASGAVVQLRSRAPITEPFLTFLVEATWSSGRLLREYTVLLDPPTYTAPGAQQAPAVSAPQRTRPSDSGQIDRQQPATSPTPAAERTQPAPQPSQPARTSGSPAQERPDDGAYATTPGGDVSVVRGDTLWGIAARVRPDFRLTMNQTMVAIYEENRAAFDGNINRLRAGANLRIPSPDEIYQINRRTAFTEVQRQNSEWGGADYAAAAPTTRPSLTLVPPDEEPAGTEYVEDSTSYETPTREQEIENRIAELEAADVPDQQSLIEIRDNELASLRQELANIRGEVYEPPVVETPDEATDEVMVDDTATDEIMVDDSDAAATDEVPDEVADTTPDTTNVVTTSRSDSKSLVDTVIEFLTGFWGIIIAALVLVAAGLFWFMRRSGEDDDDDDARPWESLDSDEMAAGTISATAALQAPVPEETIVVVEQESGEHPILEDTVEAPAASIDDDSSGSGSFGSLEDTFSSETAVNLDQTDPIAEADFHMAYGLYDQAADLINGALESDPTDKGLMSKLCEIYFVWGNKDAFVDAATRLKMTIGDTASGEWDKIVIMGQQIAPENDLFAGAEVAGATEAVDLSFGDDDGDQTGALDMDFGAEEDGASDVIDLGAADESVDFDFSGDDADDEVDFDLDDTAQTPALDVTGADNAESTAEMPAASTATPTIEEQFAGFGDGTAELPSLDESALSDAESAGRDRADETAEINLDELGLDVDGISDTEVASLDDLDDTSQTEALSETGLNEALDELDVSDQTGRNPEIDPEDTGVRRALNPHEDTAALVEGMDLSDLENSGMRLATDETGQNPMVTAEQEFDPTDVGIDDSLLDATGLTQVLSDDLAVETAADAGNLSDDDKTMLAPGLGADDTIESLPDDAETLLAPMDEDDDDFDFAKTEALPPEAFTGNTDLDSTAESPAIAETDVDLDLDDLTAALKVSEIGDTVEQPRDDATVEQPRPSMPDATEEVPTMSMSPDDMSDDLHEARTMTEVGTKLDLARAYVDMGDPAGARSILEEVLEEGDDGQKQQAQQLLDSLPS